MSARKITCHVFLSSFTVSICSCIWDTFEFALFLFSPSLYYFLQKGRGRWPTAPRGQKRLDRYTDTKNSGWTLNIRDTKKKMTCIYTETRLLHGTTNIAWLVCTKQVCNTENIINNTITSWIACDNKSYTDVLPYSHPIDRVTAYISFIHAFEANKQNKTTRVESTVAATPAQRDGQTTHSLVKGTTIYEY